MRFENSDKFDTAPAAALIARHRSRSFPHYVQFGGLDLQIDADVFSPELTKTSRLTLHCLEQIQMDGDWTVLDVFTGSGVFAILSAVRGCRSVAIDISPAAVACARRNAERNGVSSLVDVRQGDG